MIEKAWQEMWLKADCSGVGKRVLGKFLNSLAPWFELGRGAPWLLFVSLDTQMGHYIQNGLYFPRNLDMGTLDTTRAKKAVVKYAQIKGKSQTDKFLSL